MKAARFYGPRDLRIESVPDPECGPGDIIIKVAANAICGTDVKAFFSGHSLIRSYPVITGHEFSGTVVEVGREARRFAVETREGREERGFREGMRVVVAPVVACERCRNCGRGFFEACANREDIGFRYDGGNAELMRLPAELLRKQAPPVFAVPDEVPLWAAAVCEPVACAIHAQQKTHHFGAWDRKAQRYGSVSGIQPGELVVVIGAGPLGAVHAELAKAAGATVILAQRSREKLELARSLGVADHYVLNAGGALATMVMAMTDGDGADVVITACPDPGAQPQAVAICRKGGCVTLFGSIPKGRSGEETVPIPTNLIHNNGPTLCGTSGASPWHLPLALELMAAGRIRAENYITHLLPLESLELMLRIRGMSDEGEYQRTLAERGRDCFAFLGEPEHGVAQVRDPFERVMQFKGQVMKALCLPAANWQAGLPAGWPVGGPRAGKQADAPSLPAAAGIQSLAGHSPQQRRELLDSAYGLG